MPSTNLRTGRCSEPGRIYLVTAVTRERRPVFRDLVSARMLIDEMRVLHASCHVDSLAWVVMPDHLHWLFSLGESLTLSETMQLLKGSSSTAINRRLCRTGPLWQAEYHDHALRRAEDVLVAARYIVANPLRAGLVQRIGDYPHWDACWL